MADNYLERKMEEHRRNGGAPPFRRKTTPTGQRPGKALIDFPPINVFVVDGASGLGLSIVEAMCKAGCRVAFSAGDDKAGAAAAQRCGAQFHPSSLGLDKSMRMLEQAWGGIDLIISPEPIFGQQCRQLCIQREEQAELCPEANAIVLPAQGVDEKAIVTMVMLLASPAAASIRGQIFRL